MNKKVVIIGAGIGGLGAAGPQVDGQVPSHGELLATSRSPARTTPRPPGVGRSGGVGAAMVSGAGSGSRAWSSLAISTRVSIWNGTLIGNSVGIRKVPRAAMAPYPLAGDVPGSCLQLVGGQRIGMPPGGIVVLVPGRCINAAAGRP